LEIFCQQDASKVLDDTESSEAAAPAAFGAGEDASVLTLTKEILGIALPVALGNLSEYLPVAILKNELCGDLV
jgi:hypothetical protein